MNDEILIQGLDLPVRIGVPEEERAAWQTLKADLRLTIHRGFDTMADALDETVDYAALAESVKALAASRPRLLLETLAAEVVARCLENSNVAEAEVTLKKRILPGTDFVAVRIHRKQNPNAP